MEIKITKNKIKRSGPKPMKLIQQDKALSELSEVEISEKSVENNNGDIFEEKKESIFIETVEKQDGFIDTSKNTHKKFSKIYFINILKNKKKTFIAFIPWVLLVILLVALFYLWFQLSDIKNDPQKAVQTETTEVVKNVSKIMVLPTDEIPKVATLADADMTKVKTQPFFVNAKVGDKLLVYSLAKKVILYDPQINKIVEVANLDSTIGN